VFRQVVELAAAKQTDKAFAKLVELGAVSEIANDDGQLYQKAADAYVSAKKQGKSALLVSPTWAEIDAVTEKVRESLKADGVISPQDESVAVFDSLSWTVAQKKDASQFEPGQRLRFIRRTKKFEHGETVEVAAVAETGLRVRRPDGMEVDFIPSTSAASFDVGESRELKVAAGDWLLLQANHGNEFINGERVQVTTIQNGRIALADGRTLPPVSTPSRTVTRSRRIRLRAKRWMKCCWSPRQNPLPPSTASSFTFPFRGPRARPCLHR